jgi:hypothetical protein
VKNILVTHALTNIPGLTLEQAKEVAQMGAYIEYCHLQSMTGPDAQHAWMKHWKRVTLKDVAKVVGDIDLMVKKNPSRLLGLEQP